jgi:hypothetical protein
VAVDSEVADVNNGMLGPARTAQRSLRRRVWDYALVQDRRPAGTYSGALTGTGLNIVPLNTVLIDPAGIVVSVASNRVKLHPGFYRVNGTFTGMYGQRLKPRIRNVTDGSTVGQGPISYSLDQPYADCKTYAAGEFEAFRIVELEMHAFHESNGGGNIWNLGHPGIVDGSLELYAELEIERLRA